MAHERATSGDDSRPLAAKNPMALTLMDAAVLLSRLAGTPVTAAMLQMDVDAGAPRNADGTLNLVHYAAWLVQEAGRGA